MGWSEGAKKKEDPAGGEGGEKLTQGSFNVRSAPRRTWLPPFAISPPLRVDQVVANFYLCGSFHEGASPTFCFHVQDGAFKTRYPNARFLRRKGRKMKNHYSTRTSLTSKRLLFRTFFLFHLRAFKISRSAGLCFKRLALYNIPYRDERGTGGIYPWKNPKEGTRANGESINIAARARIIQRYTVGVLFLIRDRFKLISLSGEKSFLGLAD